MFKVFKKVGEKHGFATNSSSYHSIIIKNSNTENDKKFPITDDFDCKKMFKKIKEVENE